MTYETAVELAHTWGMLVFFIVPFVLAVAYAAWPSNRDEFRKAARSPLDAGEE